MRKNRSWLMSVVPRGLLHFWIALLTCAFALLSGCSMRKRPTIAWATAAQVRPTLPKLPATASDIPEDQIPELRAEAPTFPLRLITTHSAPPRPHVAAPPTAGGGNDAEKSGAPLLVPQLSATETTAAQQETNQSLNIAEKNLESAHGKRLNAAQLDLVSKIRGFIKDAREAATNADWARARSLSKKARVLSDELVAAL
jgi:hypothetical protein